MEPAATPAASPAPPAAMGAPPGQLPTGSSPATMPVANRGQEAAGLAMLSVAVKVLEKSFSLMGVATEPGKDILKALNVLSKHLPAGQVPTGVQNNAMQDTMDQNRKMAMLLPLLRQGGGAPPGAGPAAGAAPTAQAA